MRAMSHESSKTEAVPARQPRIGRRKIHMIMDSTHVVEHEGGWEVMRMDGSLKGERRNFPTKEAALRKAYRVSSEVPRAFMYIHDKSGKVEKIRAHLPKNAGK